MPECNAVRSVVVSNGGISSSKNRHPNPAHHVPRISFHREILKSRQELSNEYFLAKFGVDTEENEPCKVCSFG